MTQLTGHRARASSENVLIRIGCLFRLRDIMHNKIKINADVGLSAVWPRLVVAVVVVISRGMMFCIKYIVDGLMTSLNVYMISTTD